MFAGNLSDKLMSSKIYKPNQLISILDCLFKRNSSGILSIKTQVDSWHDQRYCILILRNGALVYGGTQVPNGKELVIKLGELLNCSMISTALEVAFKRASNPNSVVEILNLLIRMQVFTWREVEVAMSNQLLLILEKIIYHPGECQWVTSNDFDLSYGNDQHGLNWAYIQQQLQDRKQKWQNFAPQIPSMDAIPVVNNEQMQLIDNPQVRDHFGQSVDGKRNLVDIAKKMGKDPLIVAKNYFNWVNNGWVSFINTSSSTRSVREIRAQLSANLEQIQLQRKNTASVVSGQTEAKANLPNLPIVLSVDDSPIVQISIKRALQDHYHVLLANKASQALEILNEKKVELMLLDLTMPDIDGLNFCKIIRAMPKFHNLPIVMVTARDGLVNKMKGRIAGTSRYLTKPFQPDQLREVVSQCINN